MSKHADTTGLLKAAEALLRHKVIAETSADARFAGLMVASAIGMAERALRIEGEIRASARDIASLAPSPNPFANDGEALVHLIRGGVMDGADDVFRRLQVDAILRTAVTRPVILSKRERQLAGIEHESEVERIS